MARRSKYLVWRIALPEPDDLSDDSRLQTLNRCNLTTPHYHGDRPCQGGFRWVTVARGKETILRMIAEALNKARYQMFDFKPSIPWDTETIAYNQEGKHAGMVRKPKAKAGAKKVRKISKGAKK